MLLLISFVFALTMAFVIGALTDMALWALALSAVFALACGGLGSRLSWMLALRRAGQCGKDARINRTKFK